MKIKKDRIRQLIREAIIRIIIENNEEKESSPQIQYGPDVLYVFDFDDCLVDSSSRRGLAPAKRGREIKSKPGEYEWDQVKGPDGKGFYYAWLRSVDYDKFKDFHGGNRPDNVKSRDSRFQSIKDSDEYTVTDMEGIPLQTVEIESKLIDGTVSSYKKALASGSKVIILTSRMNNRSGKNEPTMRQFLQSKAGIGNIQPYFAVNQSTTKGQRLADILQSPGFENIKHVVIYEDNLEKLQDMKNTVEQLGLSADAIHVEGTEDTSTRTHPNISNGIVTYTYQKI